MTRPSSFQWKDDGEDGEHEATAGKVPSRTRQASRPQVIIHVNSNTPVPETSSPAKEPRPRRVSKRLSNLESTPTLPPANKDTPSEKPLLRRVSKRKSNATSTPTLPPAERKPPVEEPTSRRVQSKRTSNLSHQTTLPPTKELERSPQVSPKRKSDRAPTPTPSLSQAKRQPPAEELTSRRAPSKRISNAARPSTVLQAVKLEPPLQQALSKRKSNQTPTPTPTLPPTVKTTSRRLPSKGISDTAYLLTIPPTENLDSPPRQVPSKRKSDQAPTPTLPPAKKQTTKPEPVPKSKHIAEESTSKAAPTNSLGVPSATSVLAQKTTSTPSAGLLDPSQSSPKGTTASANTKVASTASTTTSEVAARASEGESSGLSAASIRAASQTRSSNGQFQRPKSLKSGSAPSIPAPKSASITQSSSLSENPGPQPKDTSHPQEPAKYLATRLQVVIPPPVRGLFATAQPEIAIPSIASTTSTLSLVSGTPQTLPAGNPSAELRKKARAPITHRPAQVSVASILNGVASQQALRSSSYSSPYGSPVPSPTVTAPVPVHVASASPIGIDPCVLKSVEQIIHPHSVVPALPTEKNKVSVPFFNARSADKEIVTGEKALGPGGTSSVSNEVEVQSNVSLSTESISLHNTNVTAPAQRSSPQSNPQVLQQLPDYTNIDFAAITLELLEGSITMSQLQNLAPALFPKEGSISKEMEELLARRAPSESNPHFKLPNVAPHPPIQSNLGQNPQSQLPALQGTPAMPSSRQSNSPFPPGPSGFTRPDSGPKQSFEQSSIRHSQPTPHIHPNWGTTNTVQLGSPFLSDSIAVSRPMPSNLTAQADPRHEPGLDVQPKPTNPFIRSNPPYLPSPKVPSQLNQSNLFVQSQPRSQPDLTVPFEPKPRSPFAHPSPPSLSPPKTSDQPNLPNPQFLPNQLVLPPSEPPNPSVQSHSLSLPGLYTPSQREPPNLPLQSTLQLLPNPFVASQSNSQSQTSSTQSSQPVQRRKLRIPTTDPNLVFARRSDGIEPSLDRVYYLDVDMFLYRFGRFTQRGETPEDEEDNSNQLETIVSKWQSISSVGQLDLSYSASNGDDLGFIIAKRALSTRYEWILPRLHEYLESHEDLAIHELNNMTSADLEEYRREPMCSWVRAQLSDKAFYERARDQVGAALKEGSEARVAAERAKPSNRGGMASGGVSRGGAGSAPRPASVHGFGSGSSNAPKPRGPRGPYKNTKSIREKAMSLASGSDGQVNVISGHAGDVAGGSGPLLERGVDASLRDGHMGGNSSFSGGNGVVPDRVSRAPGMFDEMSLGGTHDAEGFSGFGPRS